MDYVTPTCPSRAPRRCAATRSPPTAASSPGTCRGSTPPALPHDRRVLDQGAVPALVPTGLLRAAAQGPGAPGAGRHPGEHPRAGVLPAHLFVPLPGPDVEAASRSPRVCDLVCPGPAHPGEPTRRRGYCCRLSWSRATSPRCARRPRCPHGGCSSAGRAPGCGPGCRGFESLQSPHSLDPHVGPVLRPGRRRRRRDAGSTVQPFPRGGSCQAPALALARTPRRTGRRGGRRRVRERGALDVLAPSSCPVGPAVALLAARPRCP